MLPKSPITLVEDAWVKTFLLYSKIHKALEDLLAREKDPNSAEYQRLSNLMTQLTGYPIGHNLEAGGTHKNNEHNPNNLHEKLLKKYDDFRRDCKATQKTQKSIFALDQGRMSIHDDLKRFELQLPATEKIIKPQGQPLIRPNACESNRPFRE